MQINETGGSKPATPTLREQLQQREFSLRRGGTVLVTALLAVIALMPQFVSRASTAISIDTEVLFSSVNDWIAVFLTIAAIGLGIAIALAVITFVGNAVLKGFGNRR